MFGLRLGKLGAAIKAGTGSAGVVPLFSRDYEATGSLGADATFTRASTATYVDSNGVIQTAAINTPRFDYSTGSRALLMEPAATNLWTHSQTFDSGNVSKIRVSVSANSANSPGGTATADTLIEDATASNTHYMRMTLMDGASTYIVSCFAKAKERTFVGVGVNASNSFTMAVFNLSTGTAHNVGGGIEDSGIENFGNGWYRCWAKTTGNVFADVAICNDSGNLSYTGDGASGLYLWGASCVKESALSSYIPTSGSAVTRAADALSYSGIAVDNETRAITDAGTVDVDDWDGVVDATINGADNLAQISSITVYTTGERPA